MSIENILFRDTWVAQLVKHLPLAQVMILESRDRVPTGLPLLLPLFLPAYVPTLALKFINFKKHSLS